MNTLISSFTPAESERFLCLAQPAQQVPDCTLSIPRPGYSVGLHGTPTRAKAGLSGWYTYPVDHRPAQAHPRIQRSLSRCFAAPAVFWACSPLTVFPCLALSAVIARKRFRPPLTCDITQYLVR